MLDKETEVILKVVTESEEPLETKEVQERVEEKLKNVTRTKLFYRLNLLRGEGLVKGKFVGPGKGVWIWWNPQAFIVEKKKKGGKK